MKQLDKIFFNSVEEMSECYGVDAKLPIKVYSNTDLVCYQIVEPFVCSYLAQYKFTKRDFCRLDGLGEQIEWLLHRVSKTKEVSKKLKSKSSRCKDTIDWVEVEYGDEYKKVKESPQSGKQSISSTLVKQLTKSEIESLRQNKRDAYALMMKMN